MGERFYLGIDVGTGSVRAGIFDATGTQRGVGVHAIQLHRPDEDFVEQSSEDIWAAAGHATRVALRQANLPPTSIAGIGFDATCSLVVLDAQDRPVTVSATGDDRWNVIVWMDHRAMAQAARINAGDHAVLQYVGGVISPEMETPKLVWLKENLADTWRRAARFLDLPDFLVHRATGSDVRSLCSTVCKWTYLGHESASVDARDAAARAESARVGSARGTSMRAEPMGADAGRWDEGYFRAIGLGDLADEGFSRIGTRVRPMGEVAGTLSERAAAELGLVAGIPVAVSIIDAHAGGLGMLGAPLDGQAPTEESLEERLALIGGTSTCHMAVSRDPKFLKGIWGPYFSAMIPGMWLTEGGQSATGALIDHVIRSHVRGAELDIEARRRGVSVHTLLNERLDAMSSSEPFPAALTRDLHVLPDHHGNRSPRADPTLRGMVSGLRLTDSVDSLARLYLATVQAIAHGTRHIIDSMNAGGYRIHTLFACGGDAKNPVFLREHADITGCKTVLPREPEAVLLGAAVLGAVASGDQPTLLSAMAAMNHAERVLTPAGGAIASYHAAKHRVFQRMYDDQMAYRTMMG